MHAPEDIVAQAAAADRSYCGPFCYENNAPMKTFMGNVPCVPLPTIMDALESAKASGGHAALQPGQVDDLRKVIGPSAGSCSTKCSTPLEGCLAATGGGSLQARLNDPSGAACIQDAVACLRACKAGQGV